MMLTIGHKVMEIKSYRDIKSKNSTISKVFIDADFQCYFLEDVDRGLKDSMTSLEIMARKIFGKTAIPTGRYRVIISYSEKFKQYLPEIVGVKGYSGIRIHSGNTAIDTLGCPLAGSSYEKDKVLLSRIAFRKLFDKMKAVEKTEEIWITIK